MARLEVDDIWWYLCVYNLGGLRSKLALGAGREYLGGFYLYRHFCSRGVSRSVHTLVWSLLAAIISIEGLCELNAGEICDGNCVHNIQIWIGCYWQSLQTMRVLISPTNMELYCYH